MSYPKILSCSVATIGLMACAGGALAQTAAPAAEGAAPNSQLADIIVTARKQNESILKVPVAESALSGQALARTGTEDLLSLSGQIPSVRLDNTSGGGGSFAIRGIGSSVIDGGVEQSVVTAIDGVQTARGVFINMGLLDLGQVEVLKGPQVLFFGKNSPGGVISLTSNGPTDKLTAYFKTGYEFNAKEKIFEGAISGPLTDTIRVRVAAHYSKMSGWEDNVAVAEPNPFGGIPGYSSTIGGATYGSNASSNLIGRVTIDYKPTPQFTATLRALGSEVHDLGPNSTSETLCAGAHPDFLGIPDPNADCQANGKIAQGAVPQQILASNPLYEKKPYGRFDATLTSLTMDYTAGPVVLTSVTAYLAYRWSQFQAANTTYGYPFYAPDSRFHQFSQELRAASRFEGPVNFTGGVYYESSKVSTFGPNAILPDVADPITGKFEDYDYSALANAKSYSAFGQIRWNIVEPLEFSAGVRYSHDLRTNALSNPFVNANSPLAPALLPQGEIKSGKVSFDNYSPEVTLSWKPVRDTLLYGSYRTGYKAGGATSPGLLSQGFNSSTDLFYKPEHINGFEIGGKSLLLDKHLRLTASAYTYKYTDLQIANYDATIVAVQPLAGNLRTKGFEVEALYNVTSGLTFNAGVGYAHSRYTSFAGVACYPGQTVATGCVGGSENLTGQQRFRSPDWTGNIGLAYEAPAFHGLVLGADGSMSFSSKYFTQENNAPYSVQSAYQLYNAGIHLRTEDRRWQLALIGRDLGNKRFVQGSYDLPDSLTPGTRVGIINRPRQFTLELTFHY